MGLSAAVYTQTTDVEVETNGLMTYDRKVVKMPEAELSYIRRFIMHLPITDDMAATHRPKFIAESKPVNLNLFYTKSMKLKLLIATAIVCQSVSSFAQKQVLKNDLRAPAYPLVTIDPNTSAWSYSNELNADVVRHWTENPSPYWASLKWMEILSLLR
jgi:hypothetical protein